jgi:Haem-binding domain
LRKHIRMLLPVAAVLIAACSILVHPYGDVKHRAADAALMNDAMVDTAVTRIVGKSCKNCHSERTEWPWYSYVAPMSWLIEGDVYEARGHMNLSHWDDYDIDKKQALLSKIAVMVKNRKMPLPRYLVLHPEAKLSDAEIDQIYQWARTERRRLRTLASTSPGTSSGASQ